ncbi:glycosyltransferase, partial [Candidatus Kryptonium thompsonii]
ILIIFLGNISHDSRSFKMYNSFVSLGYDVKVLCAKEPNERSLENPDVTYISLKRHKRAVTKILMFYLKSVLSIPKVNPDIIIASDFFSLPIAWLISKIRKTKLIYDSRELYSSLASLYGRKLKQNLIIKLERFFTSKCNLILTVSQSIYEILSTQFYDKKIQILRNLPYQKNQSKIFALPQNLFTSDDILLAYFGLFHLGRGLKLYFDILEKLSPEFPTIKLLLIGKGELKQEIEREIRNRKLENFVFIFGPYAPDQYILFPNVRKVIGLCIIEPLSSSYIFSLPNKIFEYIQHQIPFIASDFPEIKKVVEKYKVGVLVNPEDLEDILGAIKELIENDTLYDKLKENCKVALNELNWEKEFKKLHELIGSL